jgi:hypothetical protein
MSYRDCGHECFRSEIAKIMKSTMVDSDEEFSAPVDGDNTKSDGDTTKYALEGTGTETASESARSEVPEPFYSASV